MAEKKKEAGKQIAITNTKKEMLEAYNELLRELKEKEAGQIIPDKRNEEKKAQETVNIAAALSTEGVVRGISGLKIEVGKLLAEISDKMEEEVKRFETVQAAVQVREKELQEVYEIEKSAQTLAALLEAQARKQVEFEEEMARKKDDLTRDIEGTREEWEKEKVAHDEMSREQEAAEKKRREREKDEYLYLFNREKQLAKDKVEDEKAKLTKAFLMEKETKEKELAERENILIGREEELTLLRGKMAGFPKELESAVGKAVKETTERIEKDAVNRAELTKRDFAGERNVALSKIESLEKTVKQQELEIEKLSRQLESAYKRIEDIAVKTVATTQAWKAVCSQEENKRESPK